MLQNWAGNQPYHAARCHRPETVAAVQRIVAESRTVKALGARHSFSAIADTAGDLVSLERLNRVVALDPERRTVTVQAGSRYGELGAHLHDAGFALHNLASLPHITVAGACATATHGSGDSHGCLATAVVGMEIVTATGDLVAVSREQDGERFDGMVVGLGGLGVVTSLTLAIEPTYDVQQHVYERLPFAEIARDLGGVMASGASVSLFTDWASDHVGQVWRKRRIVPGETYTPEATWRGASLATRDLHPAATLPAAACTAQMGVPGPWHERLTHFRLDHTPNVGAELQTEYFVARADGPAALRALNGMRARIAPLLIASEVRTIAADALWMSPYYARDSVALHFTWQPDWPAVRALLPRIEEGLAPFAARPHWGKLTTMDPADVQSRYPRLADFRALLHDYDPDRKFANDYLTRYIYD